MPETKGRSLEEIDAAFTRKPLHKITSRTTVMHTGFRGWGRRILEKVPNGKSYNPHEIGDAL
jgi:hypothetical protein